MKCLLKLTNELINTQWHYCKYPTARPKRTVSINGVARRHWTDPAGNNQFKRRRMKMDWTRDFSRFLGVLHRSSISSTPEMVMNNSSRKCTNHIWFSSSLNVDQGYNHENVQKLMYTKIHSRKILMHKL